MPMDRMRWSKKIAFELKLENIKDRKWTIVACSALINEGLDEGIDWIIDILNKK